MSASMTSTFHKTDIEYPISENCQYMNITKW